MRFDVQVTQEARGTRVEVQGEAGLGRLLSLLQVLALDCADWPRAGVLFDLRGLQTQLTDDEQGQLAAALARALRSRGRIAVVTSPIALREAEGVRAFVREEDAWGWLGQP